MQAGLLGRKLSHSYSPQIHADLGDYSYVLFEKEPEEVEAFIKGTDWDALNVTIPYKKTVIPFLDELSPEAEKTGSVNTIIHRPDGSLYGDTTDVYGFKTLVLSLGIPVEGKKALIFGNGGAAPSVKAALEDLGAEVVIISRSGESNYSTLPAHRDAAILVNATPVGMYPNNGETVIDPADFPNAEAVLDLIYNPAHTEFMMKAEALGIPNANGLLMLTAQAKKSAELFTGAPLSDTLITEITEKLDRKMQNVILIGMPGSGKSAIGRRLAKALNRPLIDSDALIEEAAGCTIPEIFEHEGEGGFRKRETEVLREIGKGGGAVIATGGGVVTRKENYPLLHQNGRIIYIKRRLDLLPTKGRPLSQKNSVQTIYQARKPLYESFADFTVNNNGKPEETVENILAYLNGEALS